MQNKYLFYCFFMRTFLRAKIHKARVTEANLEYVGSITIDKTLMDLVDIAEYEKVLVVSNTSGVRLETYVIAGAADSWIICMNWAASHLIHIDEEIIIMAFEYTDIPSIPKSILLDKHNHLINYL